MALSDHPARLCIVLWLCLAYLSSGWVPTRSRLLSPTPRTTCLFSTSSDDTVHEPKTHPDEEDFVYTTVSLSKPMGLLMEEVEEGSACGVMIADMASGSALQRQVNDRAATDALICMGDVLVQIGGNDNDDPIDGLTLDFDQVMDILANSPEPVQLTFRRPAHHVAVLFSATGMATSCPPGTPVRQLSRQTRAPIPYDCNTGYCGTCEQIAITDNGGGGETKYIRPCVAKVDSNSTVITIANADSFLFLGLPPPF